MSDKKSGTLGDLGFSITVNETTPDTLPRLNLDDARAVLGKGTPPPWNYEQDDEGDSMGWITVEHQKNKRVTIYLFDVRGDSAEQFLNAEKVVYCVNNFGALMEEVAQLRAALERLGSAEAFTRAGIIGGHWVGKELQARVAYARAALGVNNT